MKSASVLKRALFYGAIVTAAIAVVGCLVGYLVSGAGGLVSALIGAGLTALFMGVTALSIVIASAATRGKPGSPLYYGIITGMWLLKFVLFITILLAVRSQAWVNPYVFFAAMVAAVTGSLVADAIALLGARVPYVGDIELPGSPSP